MKFYAGIGARKTPIEIQKIMTRIASKLEEAGWILRSGGANGADSAFELGVKNSKNKRIYTTKNTIITEQANSSVMNLHPAPYALNIYNKHLMARNYYQIFGYPHFLNDDSLSRFVICWTPDGCKHHKTRTRQTGGTGQAISIASLNNIPVFNLANKEDLDRLLIYINEL